MSSDTLIKADGVSKKFCLSLKKSLWYGLCDMGRELTGRRHGTALPEVRDQRSDFRDQDESVPATCNLQPVTFTPPSGLRPKEFWAVQDVSFELKRGECLGLIGRNGAGKTTLLKMLNGLIKPDEGRIETRGRVGALLALGAGFNPILTGRENICVNGSVLGLTKREIDAKLDEIIDFAEIGDFIDTPVQNYSSGMAVRLGFAVASTLDPDILLLDEVLAVGDAAFRNKCYNRIGDLRHRAATIFVSHSMEQVAMVCDKALFLQGGVARYLGEVDGGIDAYDRENQDANVNPHAFETVENPVTAVKVTLSDRTVAHGGYLGVALNVTSEQEVPNAILRIVFYDERQIPFAEWNSRRLGREICLQSGENVLKVKVGPLVFKKGSYNIGINLNDKSGVKLLLWSYKIHRIELCSFATVGHAVALIGDGPHVTSSRIA